MQKHYIVTGGGRTGSHWVEQMIKVIDPSGSVDHTNQIKYLLDLPETIKQFGILLVCRRHDIFSSAISYFVANYTDEWFEYTNNTIKPFIIDASVLQTKILGIKHWYEELDQIIKPQYNSVVDFWYEDLVLTHPEQYLGNLLGIDAKSLTYDWNRNKNPRDYSKLVVNYQELQEIYLQNQ